MYKRVIPVLHRFLVDCKRDGRVGKYYILCCALRKRVRADGTSARYLEIGNDERVSLCLSSNFVEKDSVILKIYDKKVDERV